MSGPLARLRDYELVELVGEGGMGEVYRARHLLLETDYAIKSVHPNLGTSPEVRARFLREAQTLQRLDHPNILRFVTLFEEAGRLYLVTELLEGRPLDQRASDTPAAPPDQRAHWLIQVVRGVAHAHRRGVLHRDLKPANIQVLSDDRLKILDFGIAKPIAARGLTASGHLVGTPVYLPPEIILGEKASSAAGPTWDVFTLGVVAFELFAGRLPFEVEANSPPLQVLSDLSRLYAQRRPAPDVRLACPALSDAWATAIARALSTDPSQRPKDAGELLTLLDDAPALRAARLASSAPVDLAPEDATQVTRRAVPVSLAPDEPTRIVPLAQLERPQAAQPHRTPQPDGRRRRAALAGVVGLTALAFVGAFLFFFGGAPDPTDAKVRDPASAQAAGTLAPPPTAPTVPDSTAAAAFEAPSSAPPSLAVVPQTDVEAPTLALEPLDVNDARVRRPPPARDPTPLRPSSQKAPSQADGARVGFLAVDAEPPALVYVADRFIGETPVKGHWLKPGEHVVKLVGVRPYKFSKEYRTRVRAGEKTHIRHREPSSRRAP
ncbi:MAG: protein kinase domain-containing protein [Bradymonadia bacterium]